MCRLDLFAIVAALCCSFSDGFVVNSGIATNKGDVLRAGTSLNAIDLSFLAGQEHLFPSSNLIAEASTDAVASSQPASYSQASYYTTLGLYLLSFPGIWSQIKRSTSAKVKRKTFISDGESVESGKDLRQQAGEIMAYMKANNYEVVEAGETITFRGLVQRSVSQAFFLVFCTALGMASLALVLQIQFNDLTLPVIGNPNWYYLVLLSPYAGIYYWKSGDRVDDIKVKLASNDDETENEITIEGNDDEIERMWRTLELKEKGMIKVEGFLESQAS